MASHPLAPFLKIRRAAKVHGVILHRLPLHYQSVAARHLNGAMQLHALATLGALLRAMLSGVEQRTKSGQTLAYFLARFGEFSS
jgi:hypothetical protein